MTRPRPGKPSRSHKSKKEQKKPSTVRVFEGGFVERSRKPQQHGEFHKSQLLRVDADFAEFVRGEAMRSGSSITEVTRQLHRSFTTEA
jgi:hypothetical protein